MINDEQYIINNVNDNDNNSNINIYIIIKITTIMMMLMIMMIIMIDPATTVNGKLRVHSRAHAGSPCSPNTAACLPSPN